MREKERFEAWARREWPHAKEIRWTDFPPEDDNEQYPDIIINDGTVVDGTVAWGAWQAAARPGVDLDQAITVAVDRIALLRDGFSDDSDFAMVDVTQALRKAQDKFRAALAAGGGCDCAVPLPVAGSCSRCGKQFHLTEPISVGLPPGVDADDIYGTPPSAPPEGERVVIVEGEYRHDTGYIYEAGDITMHSKPRARMAIWEGESMTQFDRANVRVEIVKVKGGEGGGASENH